MNVWIWQKVSNIFFRRFLFSPNKWNAKKSRQQLAFSVAHDRTFEIPNVDEFNSCANLNGFGMLKVLKSISIDFRESMHHHHKWTVSKLNCNTAQIKINWIFQNQHLKWYGICVLHIHFSRILFFMLFFSPVWLTCIMWHSS